MYKFLIKILSFSAKVILFIYIPTVVCQGAWLPWKPCSWYSTHTKLFELNRSATSHTSGVPGWFHYQQLHRNSPTYHSSCWSSTCHLWSYPSSSRNTPAHIVLNHTVSVFRGARHSRLEASSRTSPEDLAATGWRWPESGRRCELVSCLGSWDVETATTLVGQAQQWVSECHCCQQPAQSNLWNDARVLHNHLRHLNTIHLQ